jgi:pimeloyl-ACP methyl ester carboxylesterase
MPYPLIELGGRGPLLLVAPANGFPPVTYAPIIGPLRARFRVVCLPPRAMWLDAGEPPVEPGSWATIAGELLHGMALHGLTDVIGLGHSFGSVALLLAAVRQRARFRGLCLLDPTIPPPQLLERMRAGVGGERLRRIVTRTRARRAEFRDPDEAFAYWREKPLFADWSDDALWLYTHSMLRPSERGGGFELAWSPAWEAHYYESLYAGTWEDIERLDPALPVLVIAGATSDTFLPDAADLLQAKLPNAQVETVAGFGHLFPQAAPEHTRAILERWLREVVRAV